MTISVHGELIYSIINTNKKNEIANSVYMDSIFTHRCAQTHTHIYKIQLDQKQSVLENENLSLSLQLYLVFTKNFFHG